MGLFAWLREEWDRILGFTLMALGGLLILIGHPDASGSPFVVDQLWSLRSGGINGLFVLGTGATFLLLADLHDEWRKLDRVEARLRPGADPPDG